MLKLLLSAWLSLAAVCIPFLALGDTMDFQLHKTAAGNDVAVVRQAAFIRNCDGIARLSEEVEATQRGIPI